jgi:hypothetical protein
VAITSSYSVEVWVNVRSHRPKKWPRDDSNLCIIYCKNGPMEGLSMETVASVGNCQNSALVFKAHMTGTNDL